jgi:predicted RNase H-like HicB family nuclease
METTHYTVRIVRANEGGFWAEVPALPGCLSHGDSLEEVTAYVREAIECHLLHLAREGTPFPAEPPTEDGFIVPVAVRLPRRH